MKKFTFKSISVKVLTLALALCLGVAVVSFFGGKKAVAEEIAVDPSFALTQGASIRDGASAGDNYYGLRFETKFNQEWLDANPSSTYSFGTLIFPSTELGKFSAEENPTKNKENTNAVKFIHKANEEVNGEDTYYASVVYSEEYVAGIIPTIYPSVTNPNQTQIETVLNNLYVLDMTAISYAILDNGAIVYTEPYSDSMIKVAARLVSDEEYANLAKRYIKGEVTFGDAYVSKEDGILVVDSLEEEFVAGSYNQVIFSNQNLKAGVDYNVVDGDIDFADEFVANHIGEYHEVYFFNTNGDLLVVEVFFADKALKTPQDLVDTFDLTAEYIQGGKLIKGGTVESRYGVYVLANDVDMTGYSILNMSRATYRTDINNSAYFDHDGDGVYELETFFVSKDIGFGGVFDGRGHAISNAHVGTLNGQSYTYRNSEGATAYQWNCGYQGFFASLLEGSIVRNVAFINMNTTNNQTYTNATGYLAWASYGLVENVYVDVNPNGLVTRGPIASLGHGSAYKNVVVNFPKNDYTLQSHLDAYNGKTTFDWYYGSLYGGGSGTSAPIGSIGLENVFVVSPVPVTLNKGNSQGYDSIKNVTYAENETELHFTHGGELTGTVQDAVAAGDSRVIIANGVRRYDNIAEMSKDSVAVEKLLATGYFKLIEGQLVWHNQKLQVAVDENVDFDASKNELVTSRFNANEVNAVSIDGVKLEKGVDYKIEDDKLHLLTVATRNTNNSNSQSMIVVVETESVDFHFNNVTYWTTLIHNESELKAALDMDYATTDHNFGLYKLANNVDMTGVTFNYNNITGKIPNQNQLFGFAGIFDGDGFAIKNASPGIYGLFGNTAYGNVVTMVPHIKNVAITNFDGKGGPVIGRWNNTHDYWSKKLTIENVYVSYADGAVPNGLYTQSAYAKYNNVLLDTVGNTKFEENYYLAGSEYGADVAGKAYNLNHSASTDSSTLSGGFRFWSGTEKAPLNSFDTFITNVVSYGKTPVVYQNNTSGNYASFVNYDSTNAKWLIKNTGWSYDSSLIINYEMFMGYANNETVGLFPKAVGVKEGFQNLGLTTTSSTVGYICTTCYDTFSLTSGTCETCSAKLGETVNLTYFGNIWSSPAILNWELVDVANYVNPYTTQTTASYKGSGILKLDGVSKYNDATEMVNAYNQDNNAFKSFTDVKVDGKQLWKVVNGVLLWHDDTVNHDCDYTDATCDTPATCKICSATTGSALGHTYSETLTPNEDGTHSQVCANDNSHVQTTACVYDQEVVEDKFVATHAGLGTHATYYYSCACGNKGEETFTVVGDIIVTDPIDYNAKTQRLESSFFGEATIDSVTVNDVEMTEGNGGLVHDIENGYYKLAGMPLVDNRKSTPSQIITITVQSGEFTYVLNNVTYWTSIIRNQGELKEALDITYSTTEVTNNYGLFKLGGNIVVDTATWTNWSFANITTRVPNSDSTYDSWNGLTTRGFAGVFDGFGYSVDFNSKGAGSHGLFASLSNTLVELKNQITVKDVAFLEYQANWCPVISRFTKYHNSDQSGNVLLENVYVTWGEQAVQDGLIYEPQPFITLRNVMVNVSNNKQFGTKFASTSYHGSELAEYTLPLDSYYGGTLFYSLRRGSTSLSNVAESFVSYGGGSLGKTWSIGNDYFSAFSSTANEDNTNTFNIKMTGWSYTSSEVISPEIYFSYASNKTYADLPAIAGLKPEFYEIAKNYPLPVRVNNSTINNKLAGFYCATCGNTFSLVEDDCDNCSTVETPVALTETDNLWKQPQVFVWAKRVLADVDNSTTQRNGEMVFANTYKFNNATEMKNTDYDFASFLGEQGNDLWAVNDGILTWVGNQA